MRLHGACNRTHQPSRARSPVFFAVFVALPTSAVTYLLGSVRLCPRARTWYCPKQKHLEKSRYDTVCTLEISTPRLDYLGSYCTLFLEWRQWQSLVVVTLFQKAKAHVMAILLSDNKNNHELHQTWVHGKSHPAPHCFNCASHLPS